MDEPPTWRELLPVIVSAMPHDVDLGGDIAQNIALAVEMELEWRSKPRTVRQRTARVLLSHLNVPDKRPGGTITCSCGHWDAQVGDFHTAHVAEKLVEAGLLGPAEGEHTRMEKAAEVLVDTLDGINSNPWDDAGFCAAINEMSAALKREPVGQDED